MLQSDTGIIHLYRYIAKDIPLKVTNSDFWLYQNAENFRRLFYYERIFQLTHLFQCNVNTNIRIFQHFTDIAIS